MKRNSKKIDCTFLIFCVLLISICLFFLWFILKKERQNFEDNTQQHQESNCILINILTRTGRRRKYFENLQQSISSQSYNNTRHIKSNDYPQCDYLTPDNDVINVNPQKELGNGFYNLYLNTLGDAVSNGWVIILDDDCKLINENFLSQLAKECAKAKHTDVLVYQSYIHPNKTVYPSEHNYTNERIVLGDIDMACFCLHYTLFRKFRFDARKGGDFNFLNKITKDPQYNLKFVRLPIGIWANYDGPKHGSTAILT